MSYEWLSGRDHVLKRPDTYVGPVSTTNIKGHIFDESCEGRIGTNEVECTTSPALFKLFDVFVIFSLIKSIE